MINSFFVVTTTSVYRVTVDPDNFTQKIKKIALKGKSKFPVDYILQGGSMISVGRYITLFTPHKSRMIEHVNTRYHGDQTSEIVALFETEEEAFMCFSRSDLKFWDPRWQANTNGVIAMIGEDHPMISICRFGHDGIGGS